MKQFVIVILLTKLKLCSLFVLNILIQTINLLHFFNLCLQIISNLYQAYAKNVIKIRCICRPTFLMTLVTDYNFSMYLGKSTRKSKVFVYASNAWNAKFQTMNRAQSRIVRIPLLKDLNCRYNSLYPKNPDTLPLPDCKTYRKIENWKPFYFLLKLFE